MALEAVAEREREAARLEAEMAVVCGLLNATARLVDLIGKVFAGGSQPGDGATGRHDAPRVNRRR